MGTVPTSKNTSKRELWAVTKRYVSALIPVALFFVVIDVVRISTANKPGSSPVSLTSKLVIVIGALLIYGAFLVALSVVAARSHVKHEEVAEIANGDFPGALGSFFATAKGTRFTRNAGPGILTFFDDKVVFTPVHHGKPNNKRPGFVFLNKDITEFKCQSPVGYGPYADLTTISGPDISFHYGIQHVSFLSVKADVSTVLACASHAGLPVVSNAQSAPAGV